MKQSPLVYLIDLDGTSRANVGAELAEMHLEHQAYGDIGDFLTDVHPSSVGCVLTELRLGASTAFQLVRQLRQRSVIMPVVLLTSHATVPLAVQALKAGLFDVIEKPIDRFRLWECATRAFERHAQELDAASQRNSVKSRLSQLTGQEMQVLQMVLDGEPNKRIASHLGVSTRTIVFRRKTLMQKMNAKSVAELARFAELLTSEIYPSSRNGSPLVDVQFANNYRDVIDRRQAPTGELV
jgi:two-component system response regulator FixJ